MTIFGISDTLFAIIISIFAVLALALLFFYVTTEFVSDNECLIIERKKQYKCTCTKKLYFVVPFIDKVVDRININDSFSFNYSEEGTNCQVSFHVENPEKYHYNKKEIISSIEEFFVTNKQRITSSLKDDGSLDEFKKAIIQKINDRLKEKELAFLSVDGLHFALNGNNQESIS